jgi:protein-tyrosine kinase
MSQIYEAMKKAQHERATDMSAETLGQSGESTSVAPLGGIDVVAAMEASREQDILAGVPPFDIPHFDELRTRCAHPRWRPDASMNIFMSPDEGRGAEQFRTLRSRLYQIRRSQRLRTLLVTSAIAAEGKTIVAHNLGQAIARHPDRRVLLIDADLRSPRLHMPLGAPKGPGLRDYLRGDADEVGIIQYGQEGNLCFIGSGEGVTNPSELLSNGRLKALLERITPLFDWVIMDSPPCLPVADASVLADLCDGVLLVVRSGSTPAEISQRALQELQGRTILGVVLNAVTEASAYGAYEYYTGNNHSEKKDARN